MGWLEEVGEGSAEEVLARLRERLHEHVDCIGTILEMETDLDEDGSVDLADAGGTSAFFWIESGPDGALLLHYTAPVCVIPEGRRAFFCNLFLEGGAFQSFLKFLLLEDVVSLVGSLPVAEVTDSLLTRVIHDVVKGARCMTMNMVHLHGARPWQDAWEEGPQKLWTVPEPEEGMDPLERYRRHALTVMSRTEGRCRTVAAAMEAARGRWLRSPAAEEKGWDELLRGRLISLLLDLNTLPAYRVTRDDDDLFLHHDGFSLCIGVMNRRECDTFLYCFTNVCRLPAENREAVYETLLKEGTHPWCAKTYILGDNVGVCGYLNARLLNDNTARELLMETLDLAASVHDTLTLLHGLPSLREEYPQPPTPDLATGELCEEE